MPGAYTTGSYVAFRISVPDGVAHATGAARKVKTLIAGLGWSSAGLGHKPSCPR